MSAKTVLSSGEYMKSYRIWILEVIAIAALIYSALAVVIDPFGVFGDIFFNMPQISMLTNQRGYKISYLEKNFRRYNSYLIGGSRIAAFRPEWVETYIPDSKFYNLFVSAATEYDNLSHVKYIVENYIVKNIILQVHINDLYSFFGFDDSTIMTKLHYKVSGENVLKFYLSYLNPGGELLGKKMRYVLGIEKLKDLKAVVEETGERRYNYEESLISRDHDAYIKTEKTFHLPDKESRLATLMEVTRAAPYSALFAEDGIVRGIKLKENIASLREIKDLCDRHHVNLIVLTVPHNHLMMDMFDAEDYLAFIESLADISPFWNFSAYSSVTTDNRNYYEWSHYRTRIAKYILARMFNDSSVDIPDDFGVLVTKENVRDHIAKLRENIITYRKTGQLVNCRVPVTDSSGVLK